MLRYLRWRPNTLRLSRQAHYGHEASIPRPQAFQIQHVKFRRKWFRPGSLVTAGIVYYDCYEIYTTSVFGILGRFLDESEAAMSDKERKEMEEDLEEPLSIPLPLTTRSIEPLPYRATDPEWRMYAKVSRDQNLLRDVKGGLAEMTRTILVNNPYMVHLCGKDMKVQRSWLDVVYPYKPFPTFERQALVISDDGVSLESQTVDSKTVFRLRKILLPSSMTLSLWSFTSTLMKQNLLGTANFFGFNSNPPDTNQNMYHTFEKIRQQMDKSYTKTSETKEQDPLTSKKTQGADGSTASVDKRADAPPSSYPLPPGGSTRDPTAEPGNRAIPVKDIPGIRAMTEHTDGPWQALKAKFRQTWRPVRHYPPRGSISINGLVEIVSAKAILTVEVWAWWDPQTKKFDNESLVLRLRHLRKRQMVPMR